VLLGHPLATGVAAREGVHTHACGSLVVCARLDRASTRALPRSGLHGALPRPRPTAAAVPARGCSGLDGHAPVRGWERG
jgi:hypothetical protein